MKKHLLHIGCRWSKHPKYDGCVTIQQVTCLTCINISLHNKEFDEWFIKDMVMTRRNQLIDIKFNTDLNKILDK